MDKIDLSKLLEEYKDLLPGNEDITFYQEHGWYITPVIIDEDTIDLARVAADEFYAGILDHTLMNGDRIANTSNDKGASIYNNEFVTLQKKGLANLGFHPLILATAAILSGSESIRLFADSLVTKKPSPEAQNNTVGWHTDKAYWPTCSSDQLLTAWIPMQDCTLDMGPLFHIDKSQQWKDNTDLKRFYSFNKQELNQLESHLKEVVSDYKEVPMLLKKGQVSFHNCNTIHASRPNISKVDRMALAVHFQDHANRYQKAYKANGELIEIGYDKLCRKDGVGNPDYSDPVIFPTLLS
ncbi:phytanoyl-CoA dioxygenase family protein [Roseivirga sp.]|uniref:phytanoyl-CoA dioxygenase family protein n=1 Tax=Roseivirga sp. TaxID=1964215 RepID=UPI003B8D660A